MKTKEEIRKQYNAPHNYNSVLQRYCYAQEDVESMMEEYANQKSYSSMVVIHDLVKNLIRKYDETKSSNKKLLETYENKYPDVAKSLASEIEDCDKFIVDLKEIKNKIIEIHKK